jgi:hypothetical protein
VDGDGEAVDPQQLRVDCPRQALSLIGAEPSPHRGAQQRCLQHDETVERSPARQLCADQQLIGAVSTNQPRDGVQVDEMSTEKSATEHGRGI